MNINFTPGGSSSYPFGVGVTDNGGGSINPFYSFIVRQPSAASASQGTPQNATVGTAFPTRLQVLVIDPNANPVVGAQVTFTPPPTGPTGSFSGSNVVFTDVNGHATAPLFTANTVAGSYTVTASVIGTSSAPTFSLTNLAGAASSITASAGTPQSTQISSLFGTPLQALVRDAFNNPVPGVTVTFAAPGSGASGTFVNSPVVLTGGAGIATAPPFNANSTAGSYTVTATASGVGAPANFSLTNLAGPPSSIAVFSGSPQSATIGAQFANPLQAIVRDAGNNPVSGVNVTFSAPPSGASGTFGGSATVATNGSGVATAPAFTANNTVGSYTVVAGVAAVSAFASFNLTNNASPPTSIAVLAGSGQSATVNTAFGAALQAIVKDVNANPVANVAVTFLPPGSGAGGTFSGSTTVLTDSGGVATAPTFTANGTAGAYRVSASASGVGTPASFNLTNNPGAPSRITVSAGTPQSAPVNTTFAIPLQALVQDLNNNPTPGISVNFAAPGSGASGTFGGSATAITNANGIAVAPAFTANTTPGSYAVFATTAGVDTTANFNLTNNPGAPSSITATAGTPQNTTVNTVFPSVLQATVKDAFGNIIPNIQVTFAVPASGASATFGGLATVTTNASGIATAPALTANSTAGSYTATASATGTLGTGVTSPANFSLTNNPGAAATITASAGSSQSATINTAFGTAFQATVKDSAGNVVPNVQVTFVATGSGASGSFSAQAIVNTTASGVAVAPGFTANSTAGSYSVTASAAGVATPASFAVTNNPGAPASITVTGGTSQSALASTQFTATLQATVKDAFGNLVPNASVTFTLPNSLVTAFFVGGQPQATVLTNASGVATSPVFTANAGTGGYNASATVPGVAAPAIFALTNTPNSSLPTPPRVSITTTQLPVGTVGTAYGASVSAAGGAPPYSFSASGLPQGLTMNSSGAITGIPTVAGAQGIGVQVTDSAGSGASGSLTLTIVKALVITTSSNLPDAHVGQAYSVTFQATGGQPGYFWTISSGLSASDNSSKERSASSPDAAPAGFIFTSTSTSATLSGTPTGVGTYNFTVGVADTAGVSAFKSFSFASTPVGGSGSPGTPNGPPAVQVSQTSLTFQGPQGGNPPPPQYLSIVASNDQPLLATVSIDGGGTGLPAPPWLSVRFTAATTPARLGVRVLPTGLPAGTYRARVLVNYPGQPTIIVNIVFTIDLTPPQLLVAPEFLRFIAITGSTAAQPQALLVENLGSGGPLPFKATVVGNTPWLTVTPGSSSTVVGGDAPLSVTVNPQGLKIGPYLGTIHIEASPSDAVDVPVSLFVSPPGPIITLNPLGIRFDARAGNGLTVPQQITVLDSGTETVNWTADLLAGQSWFSLSPASGQSTTKSSSQLTATVNAEGLQAGAYYGLIRVSDPQALNSPQYAVAVLNVQPAAAGPDPNLAPAGLFFTAAPGSAAPGPQVLQVFVSSDAPSPYQAAASTDDGGSWLSINQQAGTASTSTPGKIAVTVNPAGLKPGVYTGDVSVSFSSQTIRTANITLVVLAAGGTASASSTAKDERSAACAPTQLALTSTSLVNAFASPAGWPTPLIVRVTDDCGGGAAGAQVVATFSNGDPPLKLSMTDPAAALFSGTWAPKNTANQMTVTVAGLLPGLASATARLTGTVGGNTAPALSTNGTVNNLNPAPGAAVAPGTVSGVYGSGLTPTTLQPGVFPLPTLFNGTSVLVGAYLAPLYYLSDGQLNIQIPTELTPNRQYSILVSSGSAFTLPDTLTTTDVSPGLLNFAQHADFTTVTAASPAKAGETILLYLVGMGATDPAVASGLAAPSAPPANVSNTALVSINGQNAQVSFSGLTPGLVGLYQINVQVPDGTASGNASVTVTQNDTASNTVTIPIQ